MKPMQMFLVAVRIAIWVAATGLFWTYVHISPKNAFVTDLGAIALFFACYAITPRIPPLDRLLRRV